MEEKKQKEKELQQIEEQDGLSISTKINELAMTLTARVEAVNIVTEVLNSWLNVRQSNEKIKLSEKLISYTTHSKDWAVYINKSLNN